MKILEALRRIENRKTPKISVEKIRARRKENVYTYSVPANYGTKKCKEPEPLIDVLKEKNEVIILAQFPGFNREDIISSVKNQRLTLSAESSDRKYHKSLNLPTEVIPSSMRITYKNGVLQIRLKRAVEEKALDKLVG